MSPDEIREGILHSLGGAATTENQLEAMASLAEDIGLPMFKASSVLRYHREGNRHMAAASFLLWEMTGNVRDPQKHEKREKERKLYLDS